MFSEKSVCGCRLACLNVALPMAACLSSDRFVGRLAAGERLIQILLPVVFGVRNWYFF